MPQRRVSSTPQSKIKKRARKRNQKHVIRDHINMLDTLFYPSENKGVSEFLRQDTIDRLEQRIEIGKTDLKEARDLMGKALTSVRWFTKLSKELDEKMLVMRVHNAQRLREGKSILYDHNIEADTNKTMLKYWIGRMANSSRHFNLQICSYKHLCKLRHLWHKRYSASFVPLPRYVDDGTPWHST